MPYLRPAAILAALSVLLPLTAPAAGPALTVVNYHLLSEVRQTRTTSLLTYSADLVNTGQAQPSVTATVVSTVPSIVVQSGAGSLHFPPAPANSTVTSTNFFAVMVDRTSNTDFSNLVWSFSTPVANAGPNQTVATLATVTLNGSASTNPSGQGTLGYSWVFSAAGGRPAGSSALILNATSITPTFVADVAGTYTIVLTVSNGAGVDSASVVVTTTNSPPVANAGQNQSLKAGATVILNGSASHDVDGDSLTYSWSLVVLPPGSLSVLTGATTVSATFVADKVGTYKAQLTVNDGHSNSSPAQVTITSNDTAPVANAGPAQSVTQGALVQLTGAQSTDVDGDPLTYHWSFNSKPDGSAAVLSNAGIVNPIFTADKAGNYVVQLIVNDGFDDSDASTVTISTNSLLAPTASAGPSQTVSHGALVTLSGSGTDPQGLALTLHWSLTGKPSGSTAVLSSPGISQPTFTADVPGNYVAQLIVNNGTLDSVPATVMITTTNTPPVADAGAAQVVSMGATVTLNGGASSDADHDPITFAWSLQSKPSGSTASLLSPNIVSPTFIADVAGPYVAQLIVSDAFSSSAPVTVMITAASSGIVLTPNPLDLLLNGTGTLTVTLGVNAGINGQAINLGIPDSTVVTAPASVTIPAGTNSTTVVITPVGIGSSQIIASAPGSGFQPGFTTVNVTQPSIGLSFSNATVGLTKTVTGTVTLSAPAPAGGITVALSALPIDIVSFPASVIIPSGNTGTFTVTGASAGTTTITASSPNYVSGAAGLTASTLGAITLQSGVSVVSGQSAPLAVTLVSPAPVGGVTIALTSGDTTKLTVTPSVFIAGGATAPAVQAQVTGVNFGTVAITAAAGGFTGANVNVTVVAGLVLSPSSLPIGTVNVLYPQTTVSATGGAPPYTMSAVNLPAGLLFNITTGVISGTPTAAGSGTISLRDSASIPLIGSLTLTVNPSLLVISPSSLPAGTVGQAYSAITVSATGGTSPYVITATGLPQGLLFNASTGVLSGTPTAAGTGTINVKDSAGTPQTGSLTVVINAPLLVIAPASLPSGTVGQAYPATTVSATGGTPPYFLTSANLPQGLSFNTMTGLLNGTPTGFGTGTITVRDSAGTPQTGNLSVTINPPTLTILPASLPVGTANAAYPSTTISATGGTPAYTFISANLPAGLSFNTSTHVLSGTPTGFGVGTITVTDSAGAPQTAHLTVTINPPALVVTPLTLPNGTVGTAYPSTTISASGGTAPYTLTAANLPTGMSFAGGVLSGTPSATGTGTITVKDSATPAVVNTLSFTITAAPLVVTPSSLPGGAVSALYPNTTIAVSGGTFPYVMTAANLPSGLTFNTTSGLLSGTPLASGTGTITIHDTGTPVQTTTRTVTINSALQISPATLPVGVAGSVYPTTTVSAAGGTPSYTFTASGLPTGLVFNASTGAISGTPSTAGNATITVTDSTSPTHLTNSVTLTVNPAPLVLSPQSLSNGAVGASYPATTISASGGTQPYVVTGVNIPAGMAFIPGTGVLSGTPTAPGTGTINIHDSSSPQLTGSLSFTINPALTVGPSPLPVGAVGAAYPATTVTPSGGTPPYFLSVAALPSGLLFNTSSGLISGTPLAAGSAVVTVKDSTSPTQLIVTLPLTINPPLVAAPASLPIGTANVLYPQTTVSASGGTPPYSFTATGLPAGLSFNTSTGIISGTPGAAANATITIQDSTAGTHLTRTLTLLVNAPFVVTPASLPVGSSGVAYPSTTVSAAGGQPPYTFVASGIPSGLSFNASTGVIGGTPNALGSGTITVSDSTTPTANSFVRTLTVGVGQLTITTTSLTSGTQNSNYSSTVTAIGGTPSYTFVATGLPSGLSMRNTGQITGVPGAAGTFSVLVTVTDSASPVASTNATFPLVIAPPQLTIVTTSLTDGTQGLQYPNNTLFATGGTPPYTWSKISGSLPTGLSLNPAGRIEGIVGAAAQTTTLVLGVRDSTLPTQMTAQTGTLTLTVNANITTPYLTITNASVGQYLETALAVTLNNFNGTPTTVTISSDNPNVLLTKFEGSTGGQSITVGSAQGGVVSNFVVFAYGLASAGSANITAHSSTPAAANGDGASVVTLTPSGFVLSGPDGVGASLLLNQHSTTSLSVIAKQLDAGGNPGNTQQVGPQFSVTCSPQPCSTNPLVVPLSSSNSPAAGSIPASVSFGGGLDTVAFDFVAPVSVASQVSTTITVNEPQPFNTPIGAANMIAITVQPTKLTPTNATVGQNLETTAQVLLGAAVTSPTQVTISSSDSSKLLLAKQPTDIGAQTIVMTIACNQQGFCGSATQPFYVYGLASSGTVGYSATAAGIGTATGVVTMTPSGFTIENPFGSMGADFGAVTGNSPSFLNVDAVRLDSSGNFAEQQSLAGGQNVSINVTSSDHSVGTVTSPVIITGGNFNNTSQFTPLGAGATLLALTTPAGFTTPSTGTSETANVNNPSINLTGGFTIGQNLEQQGTLFLGVPAPAGGTSVLLTATGSIKLSNSATTQGTTSITVTVPAGQFIGSFYMFGLDSIGTASVTATAPGYKTATSVNSLAPSGIVVSDAFLDIDPLLGSFDIQTTLAANNASVTVSTALLDPNTSRFVAAQALAPTADGSPLLASVTSGSPGIGTITTPASIAVGTSSSAVHFAPVAVGTTTITAARPQGFTTPQSGRTVNVNVGQ